MDGLTACDWEWEKHSSTRCFVFTRVMGHSRVVDTTWNRVCFAFDCALQACLVYSLTRALCVKPIFPFSCVRAPPPRNDQSGPRPRQLHVRPGSKGIRPRRQRNTAVQEA